MAAAVGIGVALEEIDQLENLVGSGHGAQGSGAEANEDNEVVVDCRVLPSLCQQACARRLYSGPAPFRIARRLL
jgi:hypothetical protein